MLLLGSVLTGCAYEYEDDHWDDDPPSASAPASTGAALPPPPSQNRPVSGEELDDWADAVLPDAEGRVLHEGYGSVDAGAAQSQATTPLPSGSYAVTLACRSMARVSFTVRNGENSLVDLNLRCGTSRVNVVYLSADTVLTVQVAGRAAANFAYAVTRI
ncbi:MAG: hypothetical protein JWO49_1382 [Arthrobacter sp.]|nr:hypothetical protein [Arthrobacter sp.]